MSASLLSLFIGSFLAATLLPGGSEAVLFGVLKAYPEMLWVALFVAATGNTLGGMVSFGMGWMLPQPENNVRTAEHPASPQEHTRRLRHVDTLRRYGTPALLLAWMPLIGDALCLAAGWLRLNPWQAALFMALGKFARYWVIAVTVV